MYTVAQSYLGKIHVNISTFLGITQQDAGAYFVDKKWQSNGRDERRGIPGLSDGVLRIYEHIVLQEKT